MATKKDTPTTSSPEVYETTEVITTDVKENVEQIKETTNEDIDRGKISSKDAYNKFKSAIFDTKEADFSELAGKGKKKKPVGFIQDLKEYEIVPGGHPNETPLQKYHRLRYELNQLSDELHQKAESGKEGKAHDSQVDPSVIVTEVQLLQSQLQKLYEDERIQAVLHAKYDLPQEGKLQEEISKKLLAHLKTTIQQEASKPGEGAADKKGAVTYELYYTPEKSKQVQLTKVAQLEKKLSDLEALIGNTSNNLISGNLIENLEQLKEKVNLLGQPHHLEIIQGKVNALTQEITSLQQHSEAFTSSQEEKIREIFEIVKRWDTVAKQIPAIVSRLSALKTLHEKSADFSQNISHLETQQKEIQNVAKSNADILGKLEESFAQNVAIIQGNVQSLDKRFAELTKKMEASGK